MCSGKEKWSIDENVKKQIKKHNAISSWTQGLILSEELEKYLSSIVPRLLQENFF
jgi:hypothetical protein